MIHLRGKLDTGTIRPFKALLEWQLAQNAVNVITELSELEYVNSTSVQVLIALNDLYQEAGGEIALVDMHPRVKIVMAAIKIDLFFKVFDSVEEAMGILDP